MKIYRILGKRGRITIPYEVRRHIGFKYNDVLSFSETQDGKAVIVKREKICDNCEAKRPIQIKDSDVVHIINAMSDSQQQAALIQLSLKWANKQQKEN